MANPLHSQRELTPLEPLIRQVESAAPIDVPAKRIGSAIRSVLKPGAVKDAISGTWLGHALHPVLTDLVIGSFVSASLLDLMGDQDTEKASQRLIAIGALAYGPTALSGFSDWADAEIGDEKVRRAGLVHAVVNATALNLYLASLRSRRKGSRGAGVALSLAGASVLSVGGYLGGHLSFRRGIGADQTVFDPGPTDWEPAADAAQLKEGLPVHAMVSDTPVLLLRRGDEIFAIHDRCSHRGCSLSEGTLDGDEIVCPCHGSRFDVRDGALRRGPATSSQPAFQVRLNDGVIELRRLSPTRAGATGAELQDLERNPAAAARGS